MSNKQRTRTSGNTRGAKSKKANKRVTYRKDVMILLSTDKVDRAKSNIERTDNTKAKGKGIGRIGS